MRCEACGEGDRVPVRRAKLAETAGRVAVVLDVPMEECPACGDRSIDFDTARRLDEMLDAMLDAEAEVVTRHFADQGQTTV